MLRENVIGIRVNFREIQLTPRISQENPGSVETSTKLLDYVVSTSILLIAKIIPIHLYFVRETRLENVQQFQNIFQILGISTSHCNAEELSSSLQNHRNSIYRERFNSFDGSFGFSVTSSIFHYTRAPPPTSLVSRIILILLSFAARRVKNLAVNRVATNPSLSR